MRTRMIFTGAVAALLLAMPAFAQPEETESPAQKAEMAKMMADPALSPQASIDYLAKNAKQPGWIVRPNGLQYKILQNGYGRHPNGGDVVEVYYSLKMVNGKLIDGTSPGLPQSFTVSVGQLIVGWVEALQLMRVGDHWAVVIPPTLGYGNKEHGGIPPGQTLVFDIRLLSAEAPPKKPEDQGDDQK